MKTFLLVTFWLVVHGVANNCVAQESPTRINIQLLGPEQGLPSRNIRCLAQDGRGFIWVGTGQDLWRYDGYTFQNFTETLTRSIGGRTLINQIRTDPDGNVWIAHNNGFSIIDPVYFTCATIDPSLGKKDTDLKQNLDIFFDGKKHAWVAIQKNKLIKIGKNRVPEAVYMPPVDTTHTVGYEKQATRVFFDHQDQVIVFNGRFFLDEIDPNAKLIQRTNLLDPEVKARKLEVLSVLQEDEEGLNIYYKQKNGNQYFTRRYLFNTRTIAPLTVSNLPITPILVSPDNEGYIWYKSAEEIGFLNQKTGEFTNLTNRLQPKSGATTFLFASLVSADGSFWISCVDGLFKITLAREVFRKYLSVPLENPGDIGSSIRGITQDSTGKIWVSSYGFKVEEKAYMLHQIDPVTHRSRHLELSRPRNMPGDVAIPYKILFSRDQVYAITDGTQFIRIDPENGEYHSVEFPSVSGRGFTSFYKLNDHTFWMGTWGGMATIDTRDMKPVLLNDKTGKYIKNERINYFMPWSENRVLASTTNGLYVLNRDATIHEHYGQSHKDKIRIPALQTFHTVWHQNTLWVASGEGLISVDTLQKKSKLFTTEDGLADNNIYAALPDEQGNLWLSTNKGLSRFNTHTQKFSNYGVFDGLPHMEFNHGSYLKSTDGTLYFGGLNGIVAFDPSQIMPSAQNQRKVQLISYSKYASDRNQTDTVSSHLPGQKVVFQPGDRLFSFSFMSPDYQNTALNRFRYKLEGWNDNSWHLFENGNKLLFNSLPPGVYQLSVQVSVAGAEWDAYEWKIPLEVLAPWYKSVWFLGVLIFLIALIFYSIYRYRLKQVLRIQQIRNGISADMHDEIGGTLSSITFYSQALLMQIEKAEHQHVVKKIKENAQQVQEGLSDIVWSVKADNDKIKDVFARMIHVGSGLAESKGFQFFFKTDPKLKARTLNMQVRKNFYMIFKETLNNAAKYAECSAVHVAISYEGDKIKMMIRDDGKGFDQQEVKNGNGLINMQERAQQIKGQLTIKSSKENGTTVTLIF